MYCNSSLPDDDFAIKSKYHNSISSCFNPYPGFQDANLRIMFYSIFLKIVRGYLSKLKAVFIKIMAYLIMVCPNKIQNNSNSENSKHD